MAYPSRTANEKEYGRATSSWPYDMGVHKSAPRLIRRQGYLRLLGLVICAGSARNKDIDDNVAARPMSSLPTVRCPESMEEHSQVYQTPKLFSI